MPYFGEFISLIVAVSWTITALAADGASKRLGSLTTNVIRMILSIVLLGVTLWIVWGRPYPVYADGMTWFWLLASGLVGYMFGDYCLFSSYVIIGSRFGQLFMTLAPVVTAILGWMFLGEVLSLKAILAMVVTLSGIAISVLTRGSQGKVSFKLPLKGVLFGIGAGLGQGGGLILSKIGLSHYEACLPSDAPEVFSTFMPFASTMIRAVAGMAGFLLMMYMSKSFDKLKTGFKDKTAMTLVTVATVFGPFIGVSLSLMAVLYTKAGIASTIMAMTPALIILPHWLIYHSKITFKEIIGTIICLIGVSMFFI